MELHELQLRRHRAAELLNKPGLLTAQSIATGETAAELRLRLMRELSGVPEPSAQQASGANTATQASRTASAEIGPEVHVLRLYDPRKAMHALREAWEEITLCKLSRATAFQHPILCRAPAVDVRTRPAWLPDCPCQQASFPPSTSAGGTALQNHTSHCGRVRHPLHPFSTGRFGFVSSFSSSSSSSKARHPEKGRWLPHRLSAPHPQPAPRHTPRPAARGHPRHILRLSQRIGLGLGVVGAASLGAGWYALRTALGAIEAEGGSGWAAFSTAAYLRSIPRTARAVWWGVCSAAQYKVLELSRKGRVSPEQYQEYLSDMHDKCGMRLVTVLQANGGIYVKAGQLASTMSIVPLEYRELLEALQDAMPPRSMEEVEAVLYKDLGMYSAELFETFEPAAKAAASLAQVHRATLHGGGQVAVKVLYPGLEVEVAHDMGTLSLLSAAAAFIFHDLRLGWIVESLSKSVADEMDFRVEAANARKLAATLSNRRPGGSVGTCATPALVPELCTQRVMTMEWVDGCKVTDTACLEAAGLCPREVGELLMHVFADLTFRAGFVHGDPHPGNILVRPRDWRETDLWDPSVEAQPEIVILDHGVYVELDQDLKDAYGLMWCRIAVGDFKGAVKAASTIAGTRAGALLPLVLQTGALSRDRRRKLRRENGILKLQDVTRLIDDMVPAKLVDTIKIGAVIRSIASHLGVSSSRRQLINAYHAAHSTSGWVLKWRALGVIWCLEALQLWRAFAVAVADAIEAALRLPPFTTRWAPA